MEYLFSFLIAGGVCFLAQVIYDKTKLTPGHIVTILVCLGVILSFFNLYDELIKIAPGGSGILITNYGNLLYSSGLEGLKKEGNMLHALMSLLSSSSATLSFTVIVGFFASLIGHYD